MTESQNFEEFCKTHLSSMRSEVLRNGAKKPPWGKALGLDFVGGRVASLGSKQKKGQLNLQNT